MLIGDFLERDRVFHLAFLRVGAGQPALWVESAGHVTIALDNFHFGGLAESPISLYEAGDKLDCFIFILAGSVDDVTFGGVHNVGNVVVWKRLAVNIIKLLLGGM